MTIPINLTEISTFEWSENEKSVTKPPFWEASSRHVAIQKHFIFSILGGIKNKWLKTPFSSKCINVYATDHNYTVRDTQETWQHISIATNKNKTMSSGENCVLSR